MTAPLRAHEIQVNGVRSPVLEGGRSDSPEAVVFVHGNPGSSRDWQSLAAAAATVTSIGPPVARAGTPRLKPMVDCSAIPRTVDSFTCACTSTVIGAAP